MALSRRLIEARDPLLPKPQTELELLDLIDYMAKTPRRYGVYAPPAAWRDLAKYNRFARAVLEKRAK